MYAFNLATGVETRVTTELGRNMDAVIAENRVVYVATFRLRLPPTTRMADLYMRTIP